MNLPIFLKEVDDLSAELSHDNLEEFIHEVARKLPEEKRDYFLNELRSKGALTEKAKPQEIVKNGGHTEFAKLAELAELAEAVEAIKKKLVEINKGVYCLDSEYNEEWDDWYNSDVDEILFMDPQGVLQDINKAIALIHSCVDMESYKEGCELAELLSVLEVAATGDYNDYDGSPLHIRELFEHELLIHDLKHFVKECLYLTYMGNALTDKADELFCMMGNFECYEICLEDILQLGNEELPQLNDFLPLWISYLGIQNGREAEKLLEEAQVMLQDEDSLLENARQFVDVHPALYEQLLRIKQASGEDEKMLQIGKEALEKITCSHTIRGEIALLAAEYACKLNDHDEAEGCWLEAFRSNSTVINYLRVRFLSRDWSKYEAAVKRIYGQVYEETYQNNGYNTYAQRENRLYRNEYCAMLFFDEELDRFLSIGMAEGNGLGWSATFMKQGLALMLLLLYKGKELPSGLATMLDRAASACGFKTAEYCRGTGNCMALDDSDMFWSVFNQWKDKVLLSEAETKTWLDRIDKWIALRVAGIMESNRRNYYGECASYIAAFGEVQESLGIPSAKLHVMEKYRREYYRRRAFLEELRRYGMKK